MTQSELDHAHQKFLLCQQAVLDAVNAEQEFSAARDDFDRALRDVLAAAVEEAATLCDWARTHVELTLRDSRELTDGCTRRLIAACTRSIIKRLDRANHYEHQMSTSVSIPFDASTADDPYTMDVRQIIAIQLREQALEIATRLLEVQMTWPWPNMEAIDDSWSQYADGTLMDFKAFKNELQRSRQ